MEIYYENEFEITTSLSLVCTGRPKYKENMESHQITYKWTPVCKYNVR